ncbi:nuclear transport factor 2 family protein [Amycolatopsis sp. BJA-103]|uniref:nuclear transport factor 2 family protein n=1 Tax=Amycolatopsis sp. BJA-103 TaxID=1911175 RepID=UPI000C79406A|nr:nuclear transport factor 2 family protein [Amycolatopsis sp. BJA-103]AUI59017.1 phenazine biosynthesis protein PhzA/PhzB [Amycolatopsis sp. BJA-103]PNE17533.1 phenazine biosynthesis protein PhzA/PhzB [Amycolatopsis sp. BJA-103]
MSEYVSPAELFRHGLQLMLAGNIPGWIDLWAEDGTMEFPFAPEGWPERLADRAAIAAYMRDYPDHIELHEFPHLEIHQTTDPETIVVEMRAIGRLKQTGNPFDMTYIAVVTAQGGRFTSYRDYWNPLAVLEPGVDFAGTTR